MFLSKGMRYRRNSNGYSYIFDHILISGDTVDLVRRRPASLDHAFQDGGLYTGSTLYLLNRMRYHRNSKFRKFHISKVYTRKLRRFRVRVRIWVIFSLGFRVSVRVVECE